MLSSNYSVILLMLFICNKTMHYDKTNALTNSQTLSGRPRSVLSTSDNIDTGVVTRVTLYTGQRAVCCV